MIQLAGVGHEYAARTPWEHRALSGVDLEIGAHDRIVVVGANGSGKSTLAWILAGLLRPSEGTARLGNDDLWRTRGLVAIAFQHARLQLFRPTVWDDVAEAAGASPGSAAAAATRALELVGLDWANDGPRRIDELSGGEQRRVALAGLLARRPRLLVLDEPFAGLDRPSRQGLVEVLVALQAQGLATAIVTHDLEESAPLADRLLRLDAGRVVSDEPIGATA